MQSRNQEERLPAIQLKDLHLTLDSPAGPVNILRGIDLEIFEGETVAVTGPSGSGKSTVMAVTGGLERPSAGEIHVLGNRIDNKGEDALAAFRRDNLGIVFQSFHLIPTMTALENVAVPMELAGQKDANQKAEAALAEVGLSHRLDHYPSQLSGGEQQRVAIARAFANAPRLILADEPTGNLDTSTGADIMDLLLKRQGTGSMTMLLITHDPALAAKCDRVVQLADGKILPAEA